MGQRLNVEFHIAGERLLNMYFHWAGYTITALEITQEILDLYKKKDYKVNPYDLYQLALDIGALPTKTTIENTFFYDDAWKKEQLKTLDLDNLNRNNGIIAVDYEEQMNIINWEECRIVIDFFAETIHTYVVSIAYDSDDQDMKHFTTPRLSGIWYDELVELLDFMKERRDNEEYEYVDKKTGLVVQLIE